MKESLQPNQDIYQEVNLYLDNQLDSEFHNEFQKKIDTNPQYSKVLQQEQDFRNLIKEKVNRHNGPNDLLQNIKQKLRS
jgi:hypothetical protein